VGSKLDYNWGQKSITENTLFLVEGIEYPNTTRYDHWSNNTIQKLEAFECKEAVRFKLDMLIEELKFRRAQILKINKQLRNFCKADEELSDSLRYLTSIPGIGKTISVNMVARIGDWRNLKNVREIGGFLGLTPCENSTGDKINRGNITRMGAKRLRNMLLEGAWMAVSKDPEMSEFYHRIYSRHPKNIAARKAIVSVARKMTTRIYRVLKDRREFVIRDITFNKKNA
jgi:transposase